MVEMADIGVKWDKQDEAVVCLQNPCTQSIALL
jgi:hypothetical protein